MPLIVFAVAIAIDYASVARFTNCVQLAADAAAAAVSTTIARNPNVDGHDVDQVAERIAAFVFARKAPPACAGPPTVATTGRASIVTTTVGYQGVAPSNFGSALWLWRDQRQGCGEFAWARRRFPSALRSLRLGCRRGTTGQAGPARPHSRASTRQRKPVRAPRLGQRGRSQSSEPRQGPLARSLVQAIADFISMTPELD